jgi:3-oxoacyl-[acyl-carrier protein] reductase
MRDDVNRGLAAPSVGCNNTWAEGIQMTTGIAIKDKVARVLAPQVRVLAVSPGAVDTTFVPGRGPDFIAKAAAPLKRVATPEDVARATHLTYATGVAVVGDGGRSL